MNYRALAIAMAFGGLAFACDGGDDLPGQRLTFGTGAGGGGTQFGSSRGGGGTTFGSSRGGGGTTFGSSRGAGGTTFGSSRGVGGTSFAAGNFGGVPGVDGGASSGGVRDASCASVCAFAIECGASGTTQAQCESQCSESPLPAAQLECVTSAADCAGFRACFLSSTDGGTGGRGDAGASTPTPSPGS